MYKTFISSWPKRQDCQVVDSELNKEAQSSKSGGRGACTTIAGIGARPRSELRSSLLFVVVSTLILTMSAIETRASGDVLIQNEAIYVRDSWDIDGGIYIGAPAGEDEGLFPFSQLFIEGGQVTSHRGIVGSILGGWALVKISGETGSWSTGALSVGYYNLGIIEVYDGGSLTSTSAIIGGEIPIQSMPYSGGYVHVEADSTWNNSGTITMGINRVGYLSNVGTVNTTNAIIGEFGDSSLHLATVVNRGGSMNIVQQLTLGYEGLGELEVYEGGTVTAGHTVMGLESPGSGEIYLAGREGHRGVLETSQIVKGEGSATLRFAGGILRASRDEENFLSGFSVDDVMFEEGFTMSDEQYLDTGGAFIDTNGHDIGIVTSIGGSSFLTKKGEGTLILSGDNTYSGGTLVSTGTLQIGAGGNSGSVAGSIENNSALTFNHSSDHLHSGAISGTGILIKEGEGKLTLTGNNTFSGGTIVSEGNLQIGNGGLGLIRGNIENNSILTFNRIVDNTFNDVISGTGDLIKDGSGKLTLTNNNTYTGTTTINQGTLEFTAGLNSAGAEIRVTETGSLAISGTVSRNLRNNATVVSLGSDPVTLAGDVSGNGLFIGDFILPANFIFAGTTRPGDSPGRIEVNGDLTFASQHTLDVEIGGTAPGTEHDQVEVKPRFSSGGTFTLGGTAIIRLTDGFIPEKDDEFAILTADSFSGDFFDIDLSGAELPAELTWDTSDFSTTGIIRVVGQTFSRWADENGFAPDADDDPLGDGFPLLMKYALGLDPTVRASKEDMPSYTMVEENGDKFPTLIVNRSAVRDDVSIIGEVSEDLIEWTSAGVDLIEETPGKLVFRDSTHVTSGTQRFMRVKFAPTP